MSNVIARNSKLAPRTRCCALGGWRGLLLLASVTLAACGAQSSVPSSTSSDCEDCAQVHWVGRFDTSDPEAPVCEWSACGLTTHINGTGLDLALSGAGGISFQVVVDGTPTSKFTTSGSEWSSSSTAVTYHAAADLTTGLHDIEIYRDPEAMFGAVKFEEVAGVGGDIVDSPALYTRKLEIIGDSISAGYGNLGCPFSAATEDGFNAYGSVAAHAVNAEVRVEAWSGIGMVINWCGSTENTMPVRWKYSDPVEMTDTYDCTQWTPDAVVVNLGTNDYNCGVTDAAYVATYKSFLGRLRSCYPDALILCAINSSGSAMSAPIDQVVSDLDDSKIQKINLNATNWSGCDGHPTTAADLDMGNTLAARLRQELGW